MNTKSPSNIIHLDWQGPFKWQAKDKLNGNADYGIYQIYGCHPVYGDDTLLYIGKANEQTFATRLKQEAGTWSWNQDFGRINVYVGRLHGPSPPDVATQRKQIDLAEKLLILAHQPANNCQKSIDYEDIELREAHVLNWNCHRQLLPEVSGWRHGSKYWIGMHDFER